MFFRGDFHWTSVFFEEQNSKNEFFRIRSLFVFLFVSTNIGGLRVCWDDNVESPVKYIYLE
jgi:hypothetical protein